MDTKKRRCQQKSFDTVLYHTVIILTFGSTVDYSECRYSRSRVALFGSSQLVEGVSKSLLVLTFGSTATLAAWQHLFTWSALYSSTHRPHINHQFLSQLIKSSFTISISKLLVQHIITSTVKKYNIYPKNATMKQSGQIPPAHTLSFRRRAQQQRPSLSQQSLRRQGSDSSVSDPESRAEKARRLSRILQEALALIDDETDFGMFRP